MASERASRRAFFGVSALLFAASAVVTIVWCASMPAMGEMPMPGGWTMSMVWMRMPGQTWPGVAAAFLGMWVEMMVVMDAGRFEKESLFGASALAAPELKETLGNLLDRLVEAEARQVKTELEAKADYREYFNYDLKILHAGGRHSFYDKVSGDKSGGETQTPYYIAVLASMYRRESAPWPREVIVKFDAKTFPEAFAPSDRTIRASLLAAVSKLEEECCLRIVRHVKGPLTAEPREIRLGPEQVRFAYAAAQELGYEPLSVAVEKIGAHAVHLLSGPAPAPTPDWMREFLERLRDGLKEADPSILGMKRERLKREWRSVQPALTASVALAQGITPAWERVVSERLYNDSKLLGRIRSHVVAILVRADPRWEGVPPEEAPDLLEAYGVRRKPGLIRCAGAGTFRIGDRSYDVRDFQPVAHLPEAWAEAWVDAVEQAQAQIITTIENEYPFFSYVEEAGGPDGLGKRSEVALYTAGFPTPGLMSALRLLCNRLPNLRLRHWGDADVGGLRIWWFLRSQLQRPIELFRTTAQWLDNEVQDGGTPLSSSERAALTRLQGQMEGISDDDVSAARDLIESLSRCGLKLEQERF